MIRCVIKKAQNLVRSITSNKHAPTLKPHSTIQMIARHVSEGILIFDHQHIIIDVNASFTKITGFSPSEVVGQPVSILRSGCHSDDFYGAIASAIALKGEWQGELWSRGKDHRIYLQRVKVARIDTEDGLYFMAVLKDVTRETLGDDTHTRHATYHALTGLPNKVHYLKLADEAVEQHSSDGTMLAFVSLDIDGFKAFNDREGYEAGNHALAEIARRIGRSIRPNDSACHVSGDEFVLLLVGIKTKEDIDDRLLSLQNHIGTTQRIHGVEMMFKVSIGYTTYPFDNESVEQLVRHADEAMHEVKRRGGNGFHAYNQTNYARGRKLNDTLARISMAMANNEFELYYQPKVNMRTGVVFGVEALVRWNLKSGKILLPDEFLPFMAGTSLEIAMGDWVIDQALDQLSRWTDSQIHIEVSVNMSAFHLQSANFFEKLASALHDHPNVDAALIKIEILESGILHNLNDVTSVILDCNHQLGIKAALDDFGTGYSSLTHLRHLPVETIKIDRSFVSDLMDDPHDYAIVEGTINMSKAFNRKIISEGVETIEQGMILMYMGCDNAQGYVISPPLKATEFSQWLLDFTPVKQWRQCQTEGVAYEWIMLDVIRLLSQHWIRYFEKGNDLFFKGRAWPITNFNKSHARLWLTKARQYNLCDPDWLTDFERLHQSKHLEAQALRNRYGKHDGCHQESRAILLSIHKEIEMAITVAQEKLSKIN